MPLYPEWEQKRAIFLRCGARDRVGVVLYHEAADSLTYTVLLDGDEEVWSIEEQDLKPSCSPMLRTHWSTKSYAARRTN